ncbi:MULTISPECIES: sigma-70 region 4 domain-containing protein [unclassified Mesorhizobium]|uniref:sigma-70 region 4 domain-containing protein n=1 Tax=unclassified Mesorhizobium TaxID=325217 RepID=UPI00333C4C11
MERLVIHLPPKERACVLLKDVFDYSLEEIADLVGSTVGGVKAALNRGRSGLVRWSFPGRPDQQQDMQVSGINLNGMGSMPDKTWAAY